MEWTDSGVVLGVRRHGQANASLELMTRGQGRHLGLVRGGAGVALAYVAPKTGRAVSRAAGAPWADKLLRLPPFLAREEPGGAPSPAELAEAFALTGFFLGRHVFGPRGEPEPEARGRFLAAVLRAPAEGMG